MVNDDNRLFKERIFHLMLSLDIYNYKLQTEAIFNGYFTEVEKVFFSFSCKLTQLKRVLLQIKIILFTNKRL